jgi:phosphohistidine phosphatase
MSKQLLLMRHAKSSWENTAQSDFDRPLNDRGKHDAPIMAKRISEKFTPELILCSPAKRTTKTSRIFCETLKLPDALIKFEPQIYEAAVADIIHLLRQVPDQFKNVMLVGHNPTITSLIGHLSNSFVDNVPTSGVALLHLDVSNWSLVTDQCGKLLWFDYPKLENG